MNTKHEVNAVVQETIKKPLKQVKWKRTDELRACEKMIVSNSNQESTDISSSEEGEI